MEPLCRPAALPARMVATTAATTGGREVAAMPTAAAARGAMARSHPATAHHATTPRAPAKVHPAMADVRRATATGVLHAAMIVVADVADPTVTVTGEIAEIVHAAAAPAS